MFFLSAWYGIEQSDGYLHAFENTTEAKSIPPAVGVSPQPSCQNQSMVSDHYYLYWMTSVTVPRLVYSPQQTHPDTSCSAGNMDVHS